MTFDNFQLLSLDKFFILDATSSIDLLTVARMVVMNKEEIEHDTFL